MHIVFIDESGYTPDWRSYEEQPFYVLGSIAIPADAIPEIYATLRSDIASLDFLKDTKPLGQGFEIKAKDIAQGAGWWREHEAERNAVRDTFLNVPCKYDGVGQLIVVDKKAHLEKYVTPHDPYEMSLQYTVERLQRHLERVDDHGLIIYDHNKRLGPKIERQACALCRDGSNVEFHHWYHNQLVSQTIAIDRIFDFTLATSHNSIGLQVADFYSTMCYQYFKKGQPDPCDWWDSLVGCLDTSPTGEYHGFGLKTIP